MKKYYFIDFDSIKKLNVVKEDFDCKSYIQLFYIDSSHPKNIDLDSLQVFNQYAKKVEFIKVPDQKHLMGKYVSGALGLLLGQAKNNDHEYIIVSPKVSYDPYIQYLNELGYHVSRKDNFHIEEKKKEKKEASAPVKPDQKKAEAKEVKKPEKKEEVKPAIKEAKKEQVKKDKPKKVEDKKEDSKKEKEAKTLLVPKKEKKQETVKVVEEKKEEPEEIKKEDIVIPYIIPEENQEAIIPTHEMKDPNEEIYSKLQGEIKKALGKNKNSYGNRYSVRAKSEIPKIVNRNLKENKGLEGIYTDLQRKYPQIINGIYDLIKPIILKAFPDLEGYIPVITDHQMENMANQVREEVDPIIHTTDEDEIPGIFSTLEEQSVPTIEEDILTIQENVEMEEEVADQIAPIDEVTEEKVAEIIEEKNDHETNETIEKVIEKGNESGDEPIIETTIQEEKSFAPVQALLDQEVDSQYHEAIYAIIEESKQPDKRPNFIYLSLSKLLGRNLAVKVNKELKSLL